VCQDVNPIGVLPVVRQLVHDEKVEQWEEAKHDVRPRLELVVPDRGVGTRNEKNETLQGSQVTPLSSLQCHHDTHSSRRRVRSTSCSTRTFTRPRNKRTNRLPVDGEMERVSLHTAFMAFIFL